MAVQNITSPAPGPVQVVTAPETFISGSLKVWANGLRLCPSEDSEPAPLFFTEDSTTQFTINMGVGTQVLTIIYEYEV